MKSMNNKNMNKKIYKKFLIVSGGTGGHIFPAIVFGKRLESHGRIVKWLCGSRGLENEIYTSSGIQPLKISLSGSPLGSKSLIKIFGRIKDLIKSFSETSKYINEFQPDVIFLFGGYVSFAPLIIAKLKKIPVRLHEQNAIAGRVTRIAERLGILILTGWRECNGIKNFIYAGIPVRNPVRITREEALKILDLKIPDDKKIIGVAGGSLGSGPLSEILKKTAEICKNKNIDFVFLSSHEKLDSENEHFILPQWDMNPFYSICDVLVCRAGGSTLAEALKWGIPTVSVPWRGAADNHQEANAKEFVKVHKSAKIFSESGEPKELAEIILNLLDS